jgi:hypothetical protein
MPCAVSQADGMVILDEIHHAGTNGPGATVSSRLELGKAVAVGHAVPQRQLEDPVRPLRPTAEGDLAHADYTHGVR